MEEKTIKTNLKKINIREMTRSNHPVITVTKNNFRFNAACFPFFQRKDFCEVYYDENNLILALKPYQIQTEGAGKVYKNIKGRSLSLHCSSFIKKQLADRLIQVHQIKIKSNYQKIAALPAAWDDKNKWFLVNLKKSLKGGDKE